MTAASVTEIKAGPAKGTGETYRWKKRKGKAEGENKGGKESGEGNWKSSFKNRMRPSTIICHLTLRYSE